MDETLPLSALQHYLYCERQCALIHVEKAWAENRFTAEGRLLHQRCDSGESGKSGNIYQDRTVPIRSERLGLYGIMDVLETRTGPDGTEIPYPVEHKRGSPKVENWDRAQLCAQAMCLEEMLGVTVPEGAIFYGKPRRRELVVFDHALRDEVVAACAEMRAMIMDRRTPAAVYGKRCRGCSLYDVCAPKISGKGVENYLLNGLEW